MLPPDETIAPDQPIVIHPELQGDERIKEPPRDRVPSIAPYPLPTHARRATDSSRETNTTIARIEQEPGGQSPPPPELASEQPRRAFAIDALRGLFLTSMTIGFTLPVEGLPLWMYHRQFPPPGEVMVDVAGISWRDLAYGAFLFTMSAALPLTISRKIDKGETEIAVVLAAIKRYLILLFFALLIGHSNTFFLGYTQAGRMLAVIGFAIMAMIFTRRRADWNEARFRMIKRAGWVLAIAFLALSPLTYGKYFSFERTDDIIVGLAFASLFGSVIWYFTRDNLLARIGILAAAMALYLGAKNDGWVNDWWWNSPIPWAFQPSRFTLLAIVIPGTIAGDIVLRWMKSPTSQQGAPCTWGHGRQMALALLSFAVVPVVVVAAYNREMAVGTQLATALVAGGLALTWTAETDVERMMRSLFRAGAIWLMLGLFLEPFEGGIKKVPDTLTYFFTDAGLTTLLLVCLTALVDGMRRRKWVATLIDVGHNPLLCYVLFTVLINSILEAIPPMRGVLQGSPGESVLRSLLEVIGVLLIVRAMSRRRIYWRT